MYPVGRNNGKGVTLGSKTIYRNQYQPWWHTLLADLESISAISQSRDEFRERKRFKVNLKIIDLMRGQKSECILLDFTILSIRKGDLEYLSDVRPINVAFIRAEIHYAVFGSCHVLEPQQGHKHWLEKMNGAGHHGENRLIKGKTKHFRMF